MCCELLCTILSFVGASTSRCLELLCWDELWNVCVLWHVALYLGVCIFILYVYLPLQIICGNFLGLRFFQWLMFVCRRCWLGAWLVNRPNQHLQVQQVQSITGIYSPHYTWGKNQKKWVCYNWMIFTQKNPQHQTLNTRRNTIQGNSQSVHSGRLTYKIKTQKPSHNVTCHSILQSTF